MPFTAKRLITDASLDFSPPIKSAVFLSIVLDWHRKEGLPQEALFSRASKPFSPRTAAKLLCQHHFTIPYFKVCTKVSNRSAAFLTSDRFPVICSVEAACSSLTAPVVSMDFEISATARFISVNVA